MFNNLKCVGSFAAPANVPVRLTPEKAKEELGKFNNIICTCPSLFTSEPGDHLHFQDLVVPANGGTYGSGLIWHWPELEARAEAQRGKPAWRGSDFYTAFARIERQSRNLWAGRRIGESIKFWKFVTPDIITVPALDTGGKAFQLFATSNGGFVYLTTSEAADACRCNSKQKRKKSHHE